MDFTRAKELLDRLTSWRIPGNSLIVYHENKEVFRYASGYSDVENQVPMTGEEVLNMYSCSKVVTCTAALQLFEKGIFLLDDPIYEYLPEYKEVYYKDENGNVQKSDSPITFRHLFTMSAGFNYALDTEPIKKAKELTDGDCDTVTFAKCMAESVLDFKPGSRWSYSLCHDVLAAMVEVISGVRFEKYVQDNIFAPLGDGNVWFHRNDEITKRMANQYTFKTDEANLDLIEAQFQGNNKDGYWENIGKDVCYCLGAKHDSGGAGMLCKPDTYIKLSNALAHWGKAPNGERILSKGTVELMRQNQVADIPGFDWSHLKGYGYGLGVRTMVDRGLNGSIGSNGEFGWDGAGGCYTAIDPENELAMFYGQHMTNSQGPFVKARVRNVLYSCID